MANKYTQWSCSDYYFGRNKELEREYEQYVEIPFYYKYNCSLRMRSYKNLIEYDNNIKTNHIEFMIIGTLAVGYNMTLKQLRAYLFLKNINIDILELDNYLDCLVLKGIVVKNTIYDCQIILNQDRKNVPDYVVCYQLTNMGNIIAGLLGSKGYTIQKIKRIINKDVSVMGTLTKSILWNQIVLNQIIYNPYFKNFQIEGVKSCASGEKYEIPLKLSTKRADYYFEYVHVRKFSSYYRVLDNWRKYAEEDKYPAVFVFMTDEMGGEEILKKCIKAYEFSNMQIAVSDIKEWYGKKPGKIMQIKEFL